VNGVIVVTTNHITVRPPTVESRLNWEIKHPLWSINIMERREVSLDGTSRRAVPNEVLLEGDLLDAARYFSIPREMFFGALRGDGWSQAQVTVERLRWLNVPYVQEHPATPSVIRFL
jgi:hypothetical protein